MDQGLVVVIGAGVAGLQTINALAKAGIAVTCLEQQDSVGGIWKRYTNGYTVQVPWELYHFPDFPLPEVLKPKGPSATSQELAAYMDAYASQHDTHKYIRFQSRVLNAAYAPSTTETGQNTPWTILYEDVNSKEQYVLRASWLVLCPGLRATPSMTQYQGHEQFCGQMLHSKDMKDSSCFCDKNVVVVGSDKKGLDLLAEMAAAKDAKTMTLVFQKATETIRAAAAHPTNASLWLEKAAGMLAAGQISATTATKPSAVDFHACGSSSFESKVIRTCSLEACADSNVWTAGALVQNPLVIGTSSSRIGACGPVAEGLESGAGSSGGAITPRGATPQTKAAAQQAQRAAEAFASGSSSQGAKSGSIWTTGFRRWSHERFSKEKPAEVGKGPGRASLDTAKAQLEATEAAHEASHDSGSSSGLAAVAEGDGIEGSPNDATPRAAGRVKHRVSNSNVFKQWLGGSKGPTDPPTAQVSKTKQILKLLTGSNKGSKAVASSNADGTENAQVSSARSLEAGGTPSSSAPASSPLLSSVQVQLPPTGSHVPGMPINPQRAGSAGVVMDAARDAAVASLFQQIEAGPQSVTNISVQDWVPQSRDLPGPGSKASVTWRTGASADSHAYHSASSNGQDKSVSGLGPAFLPASGTSSVATPTLRGGQPRGADAMGGLMNLVEPASAIQVGNSTAVVGSSGKGPESGGFLMPINSSMSATSGWWLAPPDGGPFKLSDLDKKSGGALEPRVSVRTNKLQDMDEVVVQWPTLAPSQPRGSGTSMPELNPTAGGAESRDMGALRVASKPGFVEECRAATELINTGGSNVLRRLSGRLVSEAHAAVVTSHLLRLSDDPHHAAATTEHNSNSHVSSHSSSNEVSHLATAASEQLSAEHQTTATIVRTTAGATSTTSGVHVSVGDTIPGPHLTASDAWAGEWSSVTSNVLQHLGINGAGDSGNSASVLQGEMLQTNQSNVLRRLSWRLGQGGTNSALPSGQHAMDTVFGGFGTGDMPMGSDLPDVGMLMYHPLLSALMQARASAPPAPTEHTSHNNLQELLSSGSDQGGTHSSTSDTDKVPPLPTRSYLSLGANSGGSNSGLRSHTSPSKSAYHSGAPQVRFAQRPAVLSSLAAGRMTGLRVRARSFSYMAPRAPRSASAVSSQPHMSTSRTVGGGLVAPRSAQLGHSRLGTMPSITRLSSETSTYHLSPSTCDVPSRVPSRLMRSCDGTGDDPDAVLSAVMAASKSHGGGRTAAESNLGELLVSDYVLLLKELGVLNAAETSSITAGFAQTGASHGLHDSDMAGADTHAAGMHGWVPFALPAGSSRRESLGGAGSPIKPTDQELQDLPPGMAIISDSGAAQQFFMNQGSGDMEAASNQLLRLSGRIVPTGQQNILDGSHQHAAITRLHDGSLEDLQPHSNQLFRQNVRVVPTGYNNIVDVAPPHAGLRHPSPGSSNDELQARSNQLFRQTARVLPTGYNNIVAAAPSAAGQQFSPDGSCEDGWSAHNNIYMRLSNRVLPTTDNNIAPACTALVQENVARHSVDLAVGSLDHLLNSHDFARLSGRVLPSEAGSLQLMPPRPSVTHQQAHGLYEDTDAGHMVDSLLSGGWSMQPGVAPVVPASLLHHTPGAGGLRARLLAQRAEAAVTGSLGNLSGQTDMSSPDNPTPTTGAGPSQNAEKLRQRLCDALMARHVVKGLVRELNALPDKVVAAAAAQREVDGSTSSRPLSPEASGQTSPGLEAFLVALQADISLLPQRLAAALLPPVPLTAQPRHLSTGLSSMAFPPLELYASHEHEIYAADSTHLFTRLEGRVNPATATPLPSTGCNLVGMEACEALYDTGARTPSPSNPASTFLGHASTGSQADSKLGNASGPVAPAGTSVLGSMPFGLILDDLAHLVTTTAAAVAADSGTGEGGNSVWADQVIVQLLLQDLVHLPDRLLAQSTGKKSGLGDLSGSTIPALSTRQPSTAAPYDLSRRMSPGPTDGGFGGVGFLGNAPTATTDILSLLVNAADNLVALSAWIGAQDGMAGSTSVPASMLGSNSGTSIHSRFQARPPHFERLAGRVVPSQPGSRRASITSATLLNGPGPA